MELANRIFFKLYQCANMLHKTGSRAVQDEGLTTQQWAVLGALSRPEAAQGMGVGELARYLMVLEGPWLKIGRDVYLPCKVPSSPGAVTAVAGRTGFSIFRF